MTPTVQLYTGKEKQSGDSILADIARACLQIPFTSENPKLFVHLDHSHIEIHIRKDAFLSDLGLRNTAIDAGLLIHAIRSMMLNMHYEPIADYEVIEKSTVRIARIALGMPLEADFQHKITYTGSIINTSKAIESGATDEGILRELQTILIERQLFVQRNNSKIMQPNQPNYVIIGAYFHLGGWIETGMMIGNALEKVNKKLKTKLSICTSCACSHEVPVQDRNRGRYVLAGIQTRASVFPTQSDRNILDYFV